MEKTLKDLEDERLHVSDKRKSEQKKKKTRRKLILILVFLSIILTASCSATIYIVIDYMNNTSNLPSVIISNNVKAEVTCSYGADESTQNVVKSGLDSKIRFAGNEDYVANTQNFNGIDFVMNKNQQELYIKYVITNVNEEVGIAVQQNFTIKDQYNNISCDFKIINDNIETQYGEFPDYFIINKGCSGTIIVRLKMKDIKKSINLSGNMQFMLQKVTNPEE